MPLSGRPWAYNGTICARLGPEKVSVLFRLENLPLALHGEYYTQDDQQQGLLLESSIVEVP